MFKVYRIDTFPSKNNKFGLGERMENWDIKFDSSFETEEEAKDYIVKKSYLLCPDLSRLSFNLPDEKKSDFVNDFCFGDNYIHYLRFFLNSVPVNKIKNSLKSQGVNVIN